MAVYVSLIPKYKFSQAKRFLVKPKVKLCPTSDGVSRLGLSTGSFWMAGRWKCQEAQMGWGISCERSLACLRLPQELFLSAFPHLLACTGSCRTPGKIWRWLCACVMPKSWAADTSVSRSCGAGDVSDGESRASSLWGASGVPLLLERERDPGRLDPKCCFLVLQQQLLLRKLPWLLVAQAHC